MLIRSAPVVLLATAMALAQPPGRGGRFGPQDGQGAPPDARLIAAVAGNPRNVVKNAPYAADMVTETTQILPDGNRIRQTVTAKIYRDGEGRVRNEQSLAGLGAFAPNAAGSQVVYINDPVAGVNYALDVKAKAATKSTLRGGPAAPAGGPMGRGRGQAMPGPGFAPRAGAARDQAGLPAGGRFGRGARDQNVKTESLGRQTIEGVPADGTRTIFTIPAGQIGNDQPMQIVSETWYSPDLQVTVMSRHSDPRAGETVFRLTNVSRSAPAAALFQPPADFTVREATPQQPRQ